MIDAIHPYFRVAFGAWLMFLGYRWTMHPEKFVGSGIIPMTVPRTIRIFGIIAILTGAASIAYGASHLLSE